MSLFKLSLLPANAVYLGGPNILALIIIHPFLFFENKKGSTPAFLHGNTAFWLQLLILFLPASVPAVIPAVSLLYRMILLAANLHLGKHIVLCFYGSSALLACALCIYVYYNITFQRLQAFLKRCVVIL